MNLSHIAAISILLLQFVTTHQNTQTTPTFSSVVGAIFSSKSNDGNDNTDNDDGGCDGGPAALLTTLPVLILNTENDFHLHSDSKDLLVALNQFKNSKSSSSSSPLSSSHPERIHGIVKDRNHLSIMWKFGNGFFDSCQVLHEHSNDDETVILTTTATQDKEEIGTVWMTSIGQTMSALLSNSNTKDSAASKVLHFMNQHSQKIY